MKVEQAVSLLSTVDEMYENLALQRHRTFKKQVKLLALRTVAALQLLTGRRFVEILHTMSWKPVDNYKVQVTGLLTDDGPCVVPVLCSDFQLLNNALLFVRKIFPVVPHKSVVSRGTKQCDALTQVGRRQKYTELCWEQRNTNRFLAGKPYCKKEWIKKALVVKHQRG